MSLKDNGDGTVTVTVVVSDAWAKALAGCNPDKADRLWNEGILTDTYDVLALAIRANEMESADLAASRVDVSGKMKTVIVEANP